MMTVRTVALSWLKCYTEVRTWYGTLYLKFGVKGKGSLSLKVKNMRVPRFIFYGSKLQGHQDHTLYWTLKNTEYWIKFNIVEQWWIVSAVVFWNLSISTGPQTKVSEKKPIRFLITRRAVWQLQGKEKCNLNLFILLSSWQWHRLSKCIDNYFWTVEVSFLCKHCFVSIQRMRDTILDWNSIMHCNRQTQ